MSNVKYDGNDNNHFVNKKSKLKKWKLQHNNSEFSDRTLSM